MANEITVPCLPCRSINDTLDFYVTLGFEITYQQAKPNTYACVRRGGIELHFFTLRDYDPAQSYSTCIVLVEDVEALRGEFVDHLRRTLGKLPAKGIPRITPIRDSYAGELRFNVVDPGGNWIRFIQRVTTAAPAQASEPPTRLSRAVKAAELLGNHKGDVEGAAKMLDTALAHDEPAAPGLRLQALLLRAEFAYSLEATPLAARLVGEARQLTLSDVERRALTGELARLDELETVLND